MRTVENIKKILPSLYWSSDSHASQFFFLVSAVEELRSCGGKMNTDLHEVVLSDPSGYIFVEK